MASITITIPQADVADVAGAYNVTSTAEFKAILVKDIKIKTQAYRDLVKAQAITPSAEPNVT
jgi:hypothetical protein